MVTLIAFWFWGPSDLRQSPDSIAARRGIWSWCARSHNCAHKSRQFLELQLGFSLEKKKSLKNVKLIRKRINIYTYIYIYIMAIWSFGGAWGPPSAKSLGRCSQWTRPLHCGSFGSPPICRPLWQAGPSSPVLKKMLLPPSFPLDGRCLHWFLIICTAMSWTASVVVLLWWFGYRYS